MVDHNRETAIANHIATGSDLGDIGHSRKLLVEGCRKAVLVKAPEVYSSGSGDGDNAVDEEISGSRVEELAKGIVECIKDQYCVEVLQGQTSRPYQDR